MGSRANRRSVTLTLVLTAGVSLTLLLTGCGDGDAPKQEQRPNTQQGQQPKAQQERASEEFIRADFRDVDSNGNGTLDRQEAENALRADFEAMDLDRDGVVSLKDVRRELDRAGGGRAGSSLAKHLPYDTDGDGEITEREYLAEVRRRIYRPMDSDGNGEVSLDEAVAFHKKAGRERQGGQ